jgi:hypothetical protein
MGRAVLVGCGLPLSTNTLIQEDIMSQIPTIRRIWTQLMNMLHISKKQIPSPPTSYNGEINKQPHQNNLKYSCSIFPGTLKKNKITRRKANKTAYKSKRLNNILAA